MLHREMGDMYHPFSARREKKYDLAVLSFWSSLLVAFGAQVCCSQLVNETAEQGRREPVFIQLVTQMGIHFTMGSTMSKHSSRLWWEMTVEQPRPYSS